MEYIDELQEILYSSFEICKKFIREFQNITGIKVHRPIQKLKPGNGSSSPQNQVLPQKVHRLFLTHNKILHQVLDTKLQFTTVKKWERQTTTRVSGFSNCYFLLHCKGFPSRLIFYFWGFFKLFLYCISKHIRS